MMPITLLLTCEHGGNHIPQRYTHLFTSRRAQQALSSHRGYDLGALFIARALSKSLHAPLHAASVSRLLLDLNRSTHHPALFSEFSKNLSETEKRALLQRYYLPHREAVQQAISQQISTNHIVWHIAVHSFTPTLNGEQRHADIGLLYDPKRKAEQLLCLQWQHALQTLHPTLRIRRNYPYRGNADGFTTALRRQFPAASYLGIELEMNQALIARATPQRQRLSNMLVASLCRLIKASLSHRHTRLKTSPT